jgi:hypothetical protein
MANTAPARAKINQYEQKLRISPNQPAANWTKDQFALDRTSGNHGDLDAMTSPDLST